MVYADLESILAPESNGKQNSNGSYNNKYQNDVGCDFGYKSISVADKFSKLLNHI